MADIIKREQYLSKLRKLRDVHVIKVLTGVRRCGKSTVLTMFRDELIESGVDSSRIVAMNFESPESNINANDWRKSYEMIASQLQPGGMNYVFLDEVQTIDQWERMVDGLFVRENVDLYVTGSNAWFLSSDIATVLSGRYIEVKLLPFSFAEYVDMQGGNNYEQLLQDYMNYGSFPQVAKLVKDDKADLVSDYLTGVLNTVMIKDVMTRSGVGDAAAVTRVMMFMLDSIGNITSSQSIANVLSANYGAISRPTVSNYLNAFANSFLLYPVGRYDVKGKKLLQNLEKYYAVDTGLRKVALGARAMVDTGRVLENVVYLELLRRKKTVRIGRSDDKEIDFVTLDDNGLTEYYQVSLTVRDENTLRRELSSLRGIDDNPKYLITLDPEERDFDGIRQVNAIKWLLNQ